MLPRASRGIPPFRCPFLRRYRQSQNGGLGCGGLRPGLCGPGLPWLLSALRTSPGSGPARLRGGRGGRPELVGGDSARPFRSPAPAARPPAGNGASYGEAGGLATSRGTEDLGPRELTFPGPARPFHTRGPLPALGPGRKVSWVGGSTGSWVPGRLRKGPPLPWFHGGFSSTIRDGPGRSLPGHLGLDGVSGPY